MTEEKIELLRKIGLEPKEFEPRKAEPADEMAERIEMLEEALVELAGMIGGV